MSLLVRAAVIGGLVYAVSRALKTRRNASDPKYLPRADAPPLARTQERDDTWPTPELTSSSHL